MSYFLHFNKRVYGEQQAAIYPREGCTTFCADLGEKGKLLRWQRGYEAPLTDVDLWLPPIEIDKRKMFIVSAMGPHEPTDKYLVDVCVDPMIKKKEATGLSYTDEDWANLADAVARHRQDPVNSLFCPVDGRVWNVDSSITKAYAGQGGGNGGPSRVVSPAPVVLPYDKTYTRAEVAAREAAQTKLNATYRKGIPVHPKDSGLICDRGSSAFDEGAKRILSFSAEEDLAERSARLLRRDAQFKTYDF